MIRIAGISGNIANPSRTRSLVEHVLLRATDGNQNHSDLIDIGSIARDLGATVSFDKIPETLSDAFRKLTEADLIVIGTPVYKASYTGLLKHFFDLLDPKSLVGKTGILLATGGSEQHASVLEYQLRPLASFLGIVTAPTAVYARDTDFTDYQLVSEPVASRVEKALAQALALVPAERSVALAA